MLRNFFCLFFQKGLPNAKFSARILFVADADVAQQVERILGKDEVHEFDSRHQLHMKPPSFIDNEGGFAIYCWVFEGFVPGGAGPFMY